MEQPFARRYILQDRELYGALPEIARAGAVTEPQLARLVYNDSLPVTRRRTRAMAQHGLVRIFAAVDTPRVVALTTKGAKRAGLGINAMPLSRAALLDLGHTLTVNDLAYYLQQTEGATCLFEREYRQMRRDGEASTAPPIPDLIARFPGTRRDTFVELEMAGGKTSSQYRKKLLTYKLLNILVRWYCTKAGARKRIDALIAELQMQTLATTVIWNVAEEAAQ